MKLDTVTSRSRKLENITLNGFQAVYSGPSTLESREQQSTRLHERTCAGIKDCIQLLRNNLELSPLQSITRPRLKGKKFKATCDVAAAVYLETRDYSLPFGCLEVRVLRKRLSSHSGEMNDKTIRISQIGFSFVPPPWLSNLSIQSTANIFHKANANLPDLGFNMNLVLTNPNPLLIEAIDTHDVAALQQLFNAGLARSSDHVIVDGYHEPKSLFSVYIELTCS